MKLHIPKRNRDLRFYVLRKKCTRIGAYLLWIGVFWFGAESYNRAHSGYIAHQLITGVRMLLWMLGVMILGFVLFRLWKLFTDRSFEGVVEKSGLSHSYSSSSDPGAGKSVNYDFRLNTTLTVRTDSGKRKHIRFEQKPGFYVYYYEGNRICRLSGLPYPICDPARSHRPEKKKAGAGEGDPNGDFSGYYVCVACGRMNRDVSLPCGGCGHSLIDPKELWSGEDGGMTQKGGTEWTKP